MIIGDYAGPALRQTVAGNQQALPTYTTTSIGSVYTANLHDQINAYRRAQEEAMEAEVLRGLANDSARNAVGEIQNQRRKLILLCN